MPSVELQAAIDQLPPGDWAVGVSGGADSVATLSLLRERADLRLTVVHLNHETRGEASNRDAAFVAALAESWRLPAVIGRRSEIEPSLSTRPANPSALYRACRLELFRRVVAERGLAGVVLAHHADDQAETVLFRLLRGAPPAGLVGMSARANVKGVLIHRPMLSVRRDVLRDHLRQIGQPFREDESNQSDDYARNRLRRWLADRPGCVEPLLALADACTAATAWVSGHAPALDERFPVRQVQSLPRPIARQSVKGWLIARGSPMGGVSTVVLDRLIRLCVDASSPARVQVPGAITVRRRRGVVEASPIGTSIDTMASHEP